MNYFIVFLVYIIVISLGSSFHLLGGTGLFLPVFVILAGIGNDWRLWLVWLIAYLATGFFLPVSELTLAIMVVFSLLLHLLFSRWMSLDDFFMSRLAIAGVIALFIVIISFTPDQPFSISVVGSYLITIPVAFLWFWLTHPRERRLK
jgi:hypothetical protein